MQFSLFLYSTIHKSYSWSENTIACAYNRGKQSNACSGNCTIRGKSHNGWGPGAVWCQQQKYRFCPFRKSKFRHSVTFTEGNNKLRFIHFENVTCNSLRHIQSYEMFIFRNIIKLISYLNIIYKNDQQDTTVQDNLLFLGCSTCFE